MWCKCVQMKIIFSISEDNYYVQKCVRTYASCTVYKNDSQRSYRLLATLAGYMVVSLTVFTTARRSPLERFGLNVSC